MYLSYSGWEKHDKCGFAYWNGYVNKTPMPPEDGLGAIYGIVVSRLFEEFYNNAMWRESQPQGLLMSKAESVLKDVIQEETNPANTWKRPRVLLWRGDGPGQNPKGLYSDEDEILSDVRDTIERGFRIIRSERLLGPGAASEVKLDTFIHGHKLAGRADFRMTRANPHGDYVIIDGKGSKWREKYSDPNQLLWYSMLNRKITGRLPDRVGFVYWRYDPPESLDWFDVKKQDVDDLQQRVLGDIAVIESRTKSEMSRTVALKVFPPVAETGSREDAEQACRFCSYATEDVCPSGAEIVKNMSSRPREAV